MFISKKIIIKETESKGRGMHILLKKMEACRMEDKIDVMNRKKECNIIKHYNYTYDKEETLKIANTTEEMDRLIKSYIKENHIVV